MLLLMKPCLLFYDRRRKNGISETSQFSKKKKNFNRNIWIEAEKVWKFILEGRAEDKYEFCITFPIFVSLFDKYHLSSSSLSCLFYIRSTIEIFPSLVSRICQSSFSMKFPPNLPHCSLIAIPTISLNPLIESRIFYLQFRTVSFYRCQSYRSYCC